MAENYMKSTTGHTWPGKGHTIKAPVKPVLPCLVILVHGVNDVGEAYAAQEQGLCWGLAERLNRNYDLRPFAYQLPSENRDDKLEAKPDLVYFQRIKTADSFSPVVPFYWGFREENRLIDKNAWHGEWLDRYDNRIDKNGAKGGGAFVNASNCLPHMWAEGWNPDLIAKVGNRTKFSPTHDLRRAPYRAYQVLAALRLAMLIKIIRQRHPKVAINVVAHSMGCCVSLLAQVFLMDEGQSPADTLVLNHCHYCFEETALDSMQFRDANQTTFARIETFKNIVKAFHDHAAASPTLEQLKKASEANGFAGEQWGPGCAKKMDRANQPQEFKERDNRGKIYLYFSPEDLTVALLNMQGIGWQGVPDDYSYKTGDPCNFKSWDTLMDDLQGSGFRQRIFTTRLRSGKTFKVGLPYQHVSIREWGDADGSTWALVSRLLDGRWTPKHGAMRRINGEELSPPIEYSAGPKALPISPIDAAIALAHSGSMHLWKEVDDPRPAEQRKPILHSREYEPLRVLLNQGKSWENQIAQIVDLIHLEKDRLLVGFHPTPDGQRKYWQSVAVEENSHHSSIVSNHWHSQAVTAYDLALGEPISWSDEEQNFYDYLCEVADWRVRSKGIPKINDKLDQLNEIEFFKNENIQNKKLIEATTKYYVTGILPYQIKQVKTAQDLFLIKYQVAGIGGHPYCSHQQVHCD